MRYDESDMNEGKIKYGKMILVILNLMMALKILTPLQYYHLLSSISQVVYIDIIYSITADI